MTGQAQESRLDAALVALSLASSREKAKELIKAGRVHVNGRTAVKASQTVCPSDTITLTGNDLFPYVSRGGFKLAKALDVFHLDLTGLVCMDVGSSTGGFTDCMLKNGASKVYAVDVGHGQLDAGLRKDERVTVMEGTNIRYLTRLQLSEIPQFVSVDVSFISLSKVLPAIRSLTDPGCQLVCLVKPQFEAGRASLNKKGVVRDAAVHHLVLSSVTQNALRLGFQVEGVDFSPIRGPEGNIEYLLCLRRTDEPCEEAEGFDQQLKEVVERSHRFFEGK